MILTNYKKVKHLKDFDNVLIFTGIVEVYSRGKLLYKERTPIYRTCKEDAMKDAKKLKEEIDPYYD